ncbi:sirohydrochlorin chelatase [Salinactinospora qingdaonensis]
MVPTMMLVADGSQDTHRMEALCDLADAVASRNEAPVATAFEPGQELNNTIESIDGPLVAVPAYLAGGDLASAELFSEVDLDNRFDACATSPLGAVPSIVGDIARRLDEAGWQQGDGVVLAADGSPDQEGRQEVTAVARMLSRRVHSPVQVAYVNAWAPSVADAVERLRRHGQQRVAVAAWQLLPSADDEQLRELDVTSVTTPLWPAGLVVDTLLARHRAAAARLAA